MKQRFAQNQIGHSPVFRDGYRLLVALAVVLVAGCSSRPICPNCGGYLAKKGVERCWHCTGLVEWEDEKPITARAAQEKKRAEEIERAAMDLGLGPTDESLNEDPANRPFRPDPDSFIPGEGPPIEEQLKEDALIKDTKAFVNSIDQDEIFKNNVLKGYLKDNKIDKDDLYNMKGGFVEEWEANASAALKEAAAAAGLGD